MRDDYVFSDTIRRCETKEIASYITSPSVPSTYVRTYNWKRFRSRQLDKNDNSNQRNENVSVILGIASITNTLMLEILISIVCFSLKLVFEFQREFVHLERIRFWKEDCHCSNPRLSSRSASSGTITAQWNTIYDLATFPAEPSPHSI